jgi:hypothetical protein
MVQYLDPEVRGDSIPSIVKRNYSGHRSFQSLLEESTTKRLAMLENPFANFYKTTFVYLKNNLLFKVKVNEFFYESVIKI